MNSKKRFSFPEQKIGRIFATNDSTKNIANWEFNIAAKGIIAVPDYSYLKLEINKDFPDMAMEFIRALQNYEIQEIQLFGENFNDDSLLSFRHLTKLKGLNFLLTKINNISQLNWDDFQELGKLVFAHSKFGCEDLKTITALSKLKILYLVATSITNECLPLLLHFNKLKELSVSLCKISNEGLPTLAKLTSLEILDISMTRVTDEGLRYLYEAHHLRKLYVEQTYVTEDGVKELQKHLPDCEINIQPR